MIEKWGRGTQRIVELCVQAGHPEPQFEEAAGSVTVTFLIAGYSPPHRVEHNLTERQRRILHILSDGVPRQSKEIRDRFSPPLAERTLRDDLVAMRNLGLVELSGRGKSARWELKRPQ